MSTYIKIRNGKQWQSHLKSKELGLNIASISSISDTDNTRLPELYVGDLTTDSFSETGGWLVNPYVYVDSSNVNITQSDYDSSFNPTYGAVDNIQQGYEAQRLSTTYFLAPDILIERGDAKYCTTKMVPIKQLNLSEGWTDDAHNLTKIKIAYNNSGNYYTISHRKPDSSGASAVPRNTVSYVQIDSTGHVIQKSDIALNKISSSVIKSEEVVNEVLEIDLSNSSEYNYLEYGTSKSVTLNAVQTEDNVNSTNVILKNTGKDPLTVNFNAPENIEVVSSNVILQPDSYCKISFLLLDKSGDSEEKILFISTELIPNSLSPTIIINHEEASTEWVITHNLDRRPIVAVYDSNNDICNSTIHYDNDNQITIIFSESTSGYVVLI